MFYIYVWGRAVNNYPHEDQKREREPLQAAPGTPSKTKERPAARLGTTPDNTSQISYGGRS